MTVIKALKWLGIAYVQTFAFCVAVAFVIGLLMTFIAYPVQFLTFMIVGFILVAAFLYIFD